MAKSIKKYCNYKSAVVILLLVSFNLVSFGKDINDCCKKQTAEKKSCCMKKNGSSENTQKKSGCGTKDKKDCEKSLMDKKESKNEGTVNESKNINTETKISFNDSVTEYKLNQSVKSYFLNKYPPGIRSKLFLNISSLLI
ncbi:MAG: hypothetical protein PHN88_08285 [Ignavibacteria bacterium]|nr:hypothetical protein [Ignavibacteria bacterium]